MTQPTESEAANWAAFQSTLQAYLRRRVDPETAEDLAGEVLLRLVQHRAELETARNPTAWMLKVAGNAVADHYRRNASRQRALSALQAELSLGPSLAESETSPENATREISRCLEPMIRGLPAHYREALLLTDLQGVTQREAARHLGLSLSGMKSRVQRGRARLKQSLLRCCALRTDSRGSVLDYRPRAGKKGSKSCGTC